VCLSALGTSVLGGTAVSLDFYFYVEVRTGAGWNRPEEFALEGSAHRHLGEFTWLKGRSRVQHLFFGDRALLRFRRERPPDTENSALFKYLDLFYDYEDDERRLSWIPFEDLLVDLWDDQCLIVSARVRADLADHFGNGRQAFPSEALRTAGMDPYDVNYPREGALVEEAIDRTYGAGGMSSKSRFPRHSSR
jgi:hypothetical protein